MLIVHTKLFWPMLNPLAVVVFVVGDDTFEVPVITLQAPLPTEGIFAEIVVVLAHII